MNLQSLEDILLSQYLDSAERRFVSLLLALADREFSRPLERFTHSIDDATGPFLDRIGDLLGLERPPVPDTNVDFFGFAGEDVSFGHGLLADHEVTVGPTVRMADEAYRRMLKARAITLRSTSGLEDVKRAADELFDQAFVSPQSRTTPFQLFTQTNYVAMTGHDTRPVLPGAIDRGLILALRPGGFSAGIPPQGGIRYSRREINARSGVINGLRGGVDVPREDGEAVGMTFRDDDDVILLSTNGRNRVLRITRWDNERVTVASDFITVTGPPAGHALATGIAYVPLTSGTLNRNLIATWSEADSEARLWAHQTLGRVPTAGGSTWTLAQVAVMPRRVYGIAEGEGDRLLIADTQGIQEITALPTNNTNAPTMQLRYTAPGNTVPTAVAHQFDRIVWYDQTTNQVYSDALNPTRGFEVRGAATDGFYLEAVRNAIDKLIPRPAGSPIQVTTEVTPNAP